MSNETKLSPEELQAKIDALQKENDKLKGSETPVPEEPKEMTPEENEKLEKARKYYSELQRGQAFLTFMINDIMKGRNRNVKRRIMKELADGKICTEAIRAYALRIDEILVDIDKRLEKPVAKVEEFKGTTDKEKEVGIEELS